MCSYKQEVLIFEEKQSVHQLDSNPQRPECKSVALPIEPYVTAVHGFRWNVALVFSTTSSSTRCRMQSDYRISRDDKLR